MEAEIAAGWWALECRKNVNRPTRRQQTTGVGGVTIAEHPVMARYTTAFRYTTVTIHNCPNSRSVAFGTKAVKFDHVAHARAYEHLLRLGGNQLLWTGVITRPLL